MKIDEVQTFQVGIIGGGLAGLSLAIQCADKGFSTILFEKETFPFHKVCGEYISMESYSFLDQLGFSFQNFQLPQIKKLAISDSEGKTYFFDLPLGGFGVSRYLLDNNLYEIAKQKNVFIQTATKVNEVNFENDCFNIETNKGKYKTLIAAATFGKRSNLDIKWKRSFTTENKNALNNFIGIKYHVRFPQPAEQISLHNFKNGYCGISNIENNRCCLCYLTTAKNLQLNNNSITEMEKNVLAKNPMLKKIFSEAEFLYKEPLAISQISFQKKTQTENHVLMIGDAASVITPLCGNGMSMAMHASKIAFQNIEQFLQQKITRMQMEQLYKKQWQQAFSRRLQAGRIVQTFFGNNTGTSIFLKTMHAMPFIAKQVIRSTHGKVF